MWAASGAKGVVLVGSSVKKLEQAASEMKGELLIAAADISKEDDVKSVFEKTVAKYGKVDVLVNAAGHTNVEAMIGKVSPSQWWLDYVSLPKL
jgi:NADP-dependent 3-hydroxy acid dehydrogenase YdfG